MSIPRSKHPGLKDGEGAKGVPGHASARAVRAGIVGGYDLQHLASRAQGREGQRHNAKARPIRRLAAVLHVLVFLF
jgi:hypothetical protein